MTAKSFWCLYCELWTYLLLTLHLFLVLYCWLWMSKCLPGSSFLCKYYCPKSKCKQMLYLTSFKIPVNWSIDKFSKYLTTSSYENGFFLSCRNWQYSNLGTKKFFIDIIDIFPSPTFMGKFIRNGCFFDSLSYNQVVLFSYYLNKVTPCSWDDP